MPYCHLPLTEFVARAQSLFGINRHHAGDIDKADRCPERM